MQRKNQKGFTLMELMVVIVIVAILAAVAVPLYINYVKDAARTEAKGAIGAVITAEQVYFQQNSSYTTDKTKLNVDLTDVDPRWDIAVTAADDQGLTILATQKNVSGTPLKVQYVYSRTTGISDWKTEADGI